MGTTETGLLKHQIATKEGERQALTKDIQQLESQLYALQIDPHMQAMVGKCFKYRNSYGKSEQDWWLYVKVTGYRPKNRSLVMSHYQKTSQGHIEITPHEETFSTNPLHYHLFQVPITLKAFNASIAGAIKELEKMKLGETNP